MRWLALGYGIELKAIEAGGLLGTFHGGVDEPLVQPGSHDLAIVGYVCIFDPVRVARIDAEREQLLFGIIDEFPGFFRGGFAVRGG